MRTRVVATAVVSVVLATLATPALGRPFGEGDDPVTPGDGGFNAELTDGSASGPTPGLPASDYEPGAAAQAALDAGAPPCSASTSKDCVPVTECRDEPASPQGGILILHDISGWMTNLGWCDPSEPAMTPTITPGLVLRAFRQVPLPASKIVIQPPDGRTLVNFETNFYTEANEFERTVKLLGQRVTLKIWPSRYAWHYGDDDSDITDTPGAPYPALLVTHEYERADEVRVSVDTVWSADYRVNGGDWSPVNGTVTINGAAEPLEVVEATPLLTGSYR